MLSGFVLSHVYSSEFQQVITWRQYKAYLVARFARVYPLHFVTLGLSVVITLVIHAKATAISPVFGELLNIRAIPACLLLIQSLHLYVTAPLNTPSWSLSTEWWVYVLFPFLVGPFFRLRGIGKGVALAGIAGLFLFLMYYVAPHYSNRFLVKPGELGPPTINMTADFGYFRCLAGFLLGMLTYELYRSRWLLSTLQYDWAFVTVSTLTLLALHLNVHELLIVALFPLLILAAAYNHGRVKRALETRPLQRLGELSFSMYMVHMLCIHTGWLLILSDEPRLFKGFDTFFGHQAVYTLSQAWLICLSVVTATLLLSVLTYRYVEVPARNYLNRRALSCRLQPAETVLN
ncbi:acyltransferase [Fibrisoma montanum]|uniref:Acyltransferase n=1 Tax=Fibrisoma montanum TaxID=2305895 RepID=A0A418MK52_9BACT|nr:acyltransferase [Fibrisoma montanum]